MSIRIRVGAVSIISAAAIAGCGGGGGGGGVQPGTAGTPEVGFTSFAAVGGNQTVVMPGVSRGLSGNESAAALTSSANEGESRVKLTYDGAGNMTALSIATPSATMSFSGGQVSPVIDKDSGRRSGYVGFDDKRAGLAADPTFYGWNYQSFGVWMTRIGTTPFQSGAISAGAVTPGSAVPTTGSATFTGHAAGLYLDGAGNRFNTDAQMKAITNFQSRNIEFSTTGTMVQNLADQANPRVANPDLNLSGNLSYGAGSHRFTGDVKSTSGLAGRADGRFYGPGAQEIGGVYGLSGANGTRMIGGFGGKQ